MVEVTLDRIYKIYRMSQDVVILLIL